MWIMGDDIDEVTEQVCVVEYVLYLWLHFLFVVDVGRTHHHGAHGTDGTTLIYTIVHILTVIL